MTLKEIAAMTCTTITPAVVASVIGCDAQYIRDAALKCPELLGFPTMRLGRWTKIPRIPFLRAMGYEGEIKEAKP